VFSGNKWWLGDVLLQQAFLYKDNRDCIVVLKVANEDRQTCVAVRAYTMMRKDDAVVEA
jgi:hypothetical protein